MSLAEYAFYWESENEGHIYGCNNIVFVGWELYPSKSNIEMLD